MACEFWWRLKIFSKIIILFWKLFSDFKNLIENILRYFSFSCCQNNFSDFFFLYRSYKKLIFWLTYQSWTFSQIKLHYFGNNFKFKNNNIILYEYNINLVKRKLLQVEKKINEDREHKTCWFFPKLKKIYIFVDINN